MAGFLASAEHWEQVEVRVNDIMNSYNVPVFHAKEFHDTKPPFKTWSRLKKRKFAEEVFAASHGCLLGLSVSMRKKDYAKMQHSAGLEGMSAIGACFSAILCKTLTDQRLKNETLKQGVSFLVESGNRNNGGIERFFHDMTTQPLFGEALRSISFIKKEHCRAIQMADFFAFYSRRGMRNADRFDGRFTLPPCPIIETIKRHGPVWEVGGYGSAETIGTTQNVTDINDFRALLRR